MDHKKIVLAPVGEYIDDLFVGIREFPTERVILIAPSKMADAAEKAKKDLEKFKIPTQIWNIDPVSSNAELWEEVFKAVSEIKKIEGPDRLIINVSTGGRETRCAATSAAFVNGIKAFAVDGDVAVLLPVLKFNYYRLITDKKMKLLKLLHDSDCCSSLEQLSKKAGMSLPLISYHINGNLKSEGLKELGLVDTTEVKGRVEVKLATLGKMLISGYVS